MNSSPHTDDQNNLDELAQARRWRLILGRYADQHLAQANLSGEQLKLELS